ncbi:MAG: hypothetical protein IAE95_13545 [Chitinophagaceae bacterium]|nr:hypothetical protein [Chitinophagaceae bacterium]
MEKRTFATVLIHDRRSSARYCMPAVTEGSGDCTYTRPGPTGFDSIGQGM